MEDMDKFLAGIVVEESGEFLSHRSHLEDLVKQTGKHAPIIAMMPPRLEARSAA